MNLINVRLSYQKNQMSVNKMEINEISIFNNFLFVLEENFSVLE